MRWLVCLVLACCACVSHKSSPIEFAFAHAPPVADLSWQHGPADSHTPTALPQAVSTAVDGAQAVSLAQAASSSVRPLYAPADEATPTYGVADHRESIEVPPPPFSDGIFPCSDCHAGEPTNFTRRVFSDDHKDIVFEHDARHRWCLDCHDADDRDKLRLASGVQVPFEQSYRLCGQCHGDKYRDWRLGLHGRRSGFWNGAKTYLLCVHCHSPHSPKFKPLPPKPAPARPLAGGQS